MNTYTIGTQQYSSYMYCKFQTVISPQMIILYFMSQQRIYAKRKIAYKKQNLEKVVSLCGKAIDSIFISETSQIKNQYCV